MMDPRTAQDRAEQVLEDIQAQLARSQTTTAQECKSISGRRRKSPEERLAQLQARAEQLEAQLRAKRRKQDTREKIVLGGWIRAIGKKSDADRVRIMDFLGRFSASRNVEIPKVLQDEVAQAMRQAAAAKK